MENEHLLDVLARVVCCDYISDLKLPRYKAQLVCALQAFPPNLFPAAEWKEAAVYLLTPQ